MAASSDAGDSFFGEAFTLVAATVLVLTADWESEVARKHKHASDAQLRRPRRTRRAQRQVPQPKRPPRAARQAGSATRCGAAAHLGHAAARHDLLAHEGRHGG